MKQIIILSTLLLVTLNCIFAQTGKPEREAKEDTANVKKGTPRQNPPGTKPATAQVPVQTKTLPGTSNPSTGTAYYLSGVKVTIKTGQDNKEFPSKLYIEFWIKGIASWDYKNGCLFKVHNLANELHSNSSVELGLENYGGDAEKFRLENLQNKGVFLKISYLPNFFLDAWKIENISLTLEFKDRSGSPHPVFGSKTISFSNAFGFLNNEYDHMICAFDAAFNPLTASIEKNILMK
jgi:hypothetical protein